MAWGEDDCTMAHLLGCQVLFTVDGAVCGGQIFVEPTFVPAIAAQDRRARPERANTFLRLPHILAFLYQIGGMVSQ